MTFLFSEQAWEWVRWLNVVVAFLVVVLLTASVIARWDATPPRLRRVHPWVICTYAVIAYGSAEIAASDTYIPPGLRVGFLTLVLLGLLITLVFNLAHHED